jgi:hypothetical protein
VVHRSPPLEIVTVAPPVTTNWRRRHPSFTHVSAVSPLPPVELVLLLLPLEFLSEE